MTTAASCWWPGARSASSTSGSRRRRRLTSGRTSVLRAPNTHCCPRSARGLCITGTSGTSPTPSATPPGRTSETRSPSIGTCAPSPASTSYRAPGSIQLSPPRDLRAAVVRVLPDRLDGLPLHARCGRSGRQATPSQTSGSATSSATCTWQRASPRLRDEIVNSAGTLLSLDGNTDEYSSTALYSRNAVANWAQLSPEGAVRWNYDQHVTGLNIFRQKRDGAEYPTAGHVDRMDHILGGRVRRPQGSAHP